MKKWLILVFLVLLLPQIQSAKSPEMQMVDLINAERAKAGVAPVVWNETLAKVAAAHATDLAKKEYFSHISKEGFTPLQRVQKGGYYPYYKPNIIFSEKYLYENIEKISGDKINVALFLSKFMNNPGTKANMLSKHVNDVGIGFAVGKFDRYGVTYYYIVCVQIFAKHP